MTGRLPTVVIATRSAGKLRELRALLAIERISAIDLTEAGIAESREEDEVECYATFEENALAKARYFAARAAGRVVLADDSGLEVAALGGEPGVRSRRWSGRADLAGAALDAANNALLVERMAGEQNRDARFVCATAWCGGGREVVAVGEVAGSITPAPAGAGGFGYDPYFWVTELGTTLAEADAEAKDAVSHRGRSLRALLARLRADGLLG